MSDIVQLLPDSVANQIAAGEVVQRPASVVKELIENAIDAGADEIQLIIKEAGKTLIQVIDNGKGMSPTDARLSLERHATSKIKNADDLFQIQTMGFRGEALASIVAVAQCEVKSKMQQEELGTHIRVEGSEVKQQEPCAAERGTAIEVKNLFYNIPARRKFLKSNAVENRHIIDQFERIAIIYPDIRFVFYQDNTKLFQLEPGSLRQRIVGIFGKKFDTRLVPVGEETSLVNLSGFVCKPEFAKKKRDGQFLFVNRRFIKSNYLHHAILSAYEELLPKGLHPSYFLHMECDPASIDVNIHPTKTEVKFEDERSIYAIIRSTVRKALGEHNIAPTLDFNRETAFDSIDPKQEVKPPQIPVNPEFNPFENVKTGSSSSGIPSTPPPKKSIEGWETMVQPAIVNTQQDLPFEALENEFSIQQESPKEPLPNEKQFMQLHGKYLLTGIKSGSMIIHLQRAHERILYERNLRALAMNEGLSQTSLFPETVELKSGDAELVRTLESQLKLLGFELEDFGQNSFIVRGIPAELADANCAELLDEILFHYRENEQELQLKPHTNLAYTLAHKHSLKRNKTLSNQECSQLVDQLFGCENPQTTPNGKTIISTLSFDELQKRFD